MKNKKGINAWVIIGSVLLLYFSYTVVEQQRLINNKEIRLKEVNEKIEIEKVKNEELKKEIKIVGTLEHIEKCARENLGLVKDGERILIDVNK